jgi:ribonucleoside-triphosphate reductase
MDDYQNFIAVSRYAKWLEDEHRRETWDETVDRYTKHVINGHIKDKKQILELKQAIKDLEVMPSMRALMTAGEALERDNTCGYNCAYLPVDGLRSFDEAMFILLCGTGVGFSVERHLCDRLPVVPENIRDNSVTKPSVTIKDSKEGWADGLRRVLFHLFRGEQPDWDTSKVRPAGSRLKTFGGRASGPGPLISLFEFVVDTVKGAQGRKLTPMECHDIMCKIGEVVVVGGVRRSAMISLSNLSDDRIRHCKTGAWYTTSPHLALANNSVAYTTKPDGKAFMREWQALMESGTGERGIFNREAAKKQAGKNGRRDPLRDFGTNPCSEIILRPYQFCNLTEVVVRSTDDIRSLRDKVRKATILGTIQSSYTRFPYLRKIWQQNTEDERLLGVSLTGILDNKLLSSNNKKLAETLEDLKSVAVKTNADWADRLGISRSAAITCVKPSGTVSQLVDSASGIHPRHSKYYIRRVRGDNNDPVTQLMMDQGVPHEPCAMQPMNTTVFSFPVAAPKGGTVRDDLSAIDHLKMWLTYQRHWCEHKPSVTVSVREDEWMAVGAFVYEHFDEMSGVSFLPHSDPDYAQLPYEEVTYTEYNSLKINSPKGIDWGKLSVYELEDRTVGSQTLACSGDSCEIVDLT